MYWAERLVNPARIASARSKLGADPASIVDEVVLDVGIDLETTFPQGWTALGGEQDEVLALVRARAEELVRGPLLSALPPPG
jgi:hypothetical protein